MVEVVLADELGFRAVVPEDDDGVAVDGLTDLGVLLLGCCLDGAQVVVQPCQNHVVGAFGRCDVSLEGVGIGRHTGIVQVVPLRCCHRKG